MGVKCLGAVTIAGARAQEIIMKMRELAGLHERERLHSFLTYFELGRKRYVPLTEESEIVQSEYRCKVALKRSSEKPQPIGEVVESRTATADISISPTMVNRLFLYNGKLYQSSRNDYTQEQVHLLILNFLVKEEKKFEELKGRFRDDL